MNSTRGFVRLGTVLLVSVFTLIVAGMGGLWVALDAHEQETASNRARLLADQGAHRLREFVASRVLVLGFVRRQALAGSFTDRQTYEDGVMNLLDEFGGLQALNWVDSDGVIVWTCPRSGNEGAEGRRLSEHPGAAPYFAAAAAGPRTVMTAPLDLFQGGRGFTTYLPVVDEQGTVKGFVNGVFRADQLVEQCLEQGLLDLGATFIEDNGKAIYGDADSFASAVGNRPVGRAPVEIMGRTWTLHVAPTPGPWASGTQEIKLVVLLGGISLAIAVTLLLGMLILRRRAVEERRQVEARLQQGQKLEALGQLAGGVAHDFNNLMTVVMGNEQLMRMIADVPGDAVDHLDEIGQAARRAAGLAGQMLAFARRQVAQPKVIDLGAELASLEPMLRRLIREDIKLELSLPDEPCLVTADPVQIDQVLMNLLVNAADAMPQGGSVVVSLTTDNGNDPAAVIQVRDDGEGMDLETARKAVEPFFTTKEVGRGTGLGLSTVYGIVTAADGTFTLDSRPDHGTVAEVRWPLSADTLAQPKAEADVPPPSRPGRILVVEDEPAVRRVTTRLLRSAGYSVSEACDGQVALQLFEAERFDAVVTDAVMPVMGGVELARHLRAKDASVRVVICSGYATPPDSSDLKDLDVLMVSKPYSVETLLAAVASVTSNAMATAGDRK